MAEAPALRTVPTYESPTPVVLAERAKIELGGITIFQLVVFLFKLTLASLIVTPVLGALAGVWTIMALGAMAALATQ